MQPLYHCDSCGFMSTLRTAYKLVQIQSLGKAALLCDDCQNRYQRGDAVITKWVKGTGTW